VFDLGRAVRSVAPFVVLLALAGCDGACAARADAVDDAVGSPARSNVTLTRLIGTVRSYPPNVYRFHDSEAGVTCWVTTDGSVSCLPDSQIRRAP
jgi:hypothetical protein